MTRSNAQGVAVYFWARNDQTVPSAVKNGGQTLGVDSSWGEPEALFPTTECSFADHFTEHTLVFDLTFCVSVSGSLRVNRSTHVGNAYRVIGQVPVAFSPVPAMVRAVRTVCSSTNSHEKKILIFLIRPVDVDQNPSAFANAYWTVNAVRVYTP